MNIARRARVLMGEEPSKLGTGLAWFGLIVMTTLVMIRAMVEHDAFPWWSSDPFLFSPPITGLTPIKALVLNLGVVLSCCCTLLGLIIRREQFGRVTALLMTLGVAIIAHHGFHTFESVVEGSNLLAIVSVLFIASLAHKLGGAQQIIAAVTLGFVVLLVIMGGYEMFVIHPDTVANYEQTGDSFLAARGWTPGSFEALAYERRLYQAEPIAWFGLTNVFASFAGAGAAGLLILGWNTLKTDRISIVFLLSGMIALAGLLMTGAKGGIGAFGLGMGLTIAAMIYKRKKLDGRAIVALCGIVILGVITRGFIGERIGERIGELSLLFRSQYMVGSMRMFFAHPIFGVGPGAFQDHYTIVKPALSPEDVASAHSFGFDMVAMLGIGGLALLGMFLGIISQIRPHAEPKPTESYFAHRQTIQVTLLVIAVASVASIRFGSGAMDTNLLLIQVLASLAWGSVAYGIVRLNNRGSALQWALFATASVLAIHSMIEVTSTWIVSGMLWALMIGNACGPSRPKQTETNPTGTNPKPFVLLVLIALLGSVGVFGMNLPTLARWEMALNRAAEPAIIMSLERQELDGQPSAQLNQLEFDGRPIAIEHLQEAALIRPTHMPTWIAASQQMLWRASALDSFGEHDPAVVLWDQTLAMLEQGTQSSTGASGYHWLGSVYFGRATQFPDDPARDSWLENAQVAWEKAFERSPHNAHLALKLMNLAIERGLESDVSKWAKKSIELHEQS
ncbi:MAG: O-antigen ligase family protein, partial [Phycisphaerales bacterium]|nr:O-antigen ligase family protein [Phycisphaerales bacterium]